MRNEVFLDTAYVIALSSLSDAFHERAVQLAREIRTTGTRLVTTRATMLEIGNALSRQARRHAGIRLLVALEVDSRVEIVALSEDLYGRA